MKVYGCCRVSTAKQANGGLSPDTQRRQVTGDVMMKGWSRSAYQARCLWPIDRTASTCVS
jgi:hypothetical protein